MIKTKTLLILGAGASKPFGFPLGRRLRNEIYEMLKQSEVPPDLHGQKSAFYQISGPIKLLMEAMGKEYGINKNWNAKQRELLYGEIQNFRKALIRSGRFSVDAFLEHRLDDFETIGKQAMVIALRKYENPENFERMINVEQHFLKEKWEYNWYELLVEALIEDIPFEEFSGKNLGIVTFNYDRSLEYYLHESLMNSYGISSEEAAEKIDEIEIIHVHGKLGDLPWQNNSKYKLAYDTTIDSKIIEMAAENIKIIPTAKLDTPEFEQAREQIKWADRIFILGFGFNKQNLKRLRLGPLCKDSVDVNGTGMGLRFRDLRIIRDLKIPNLTYPIDKRLKESWSRSFHDTTIYDFLWNDIDLTE